MMNVSLGRRVALVALGGLVSWLPVGADEVETPLGEQMEIVSGKLKSLRKLRESEDRWSASAERVREAQKALIKALEFEPALLGEMPDGPEKKKAVADYKRLMGLSLAALCELELAFLNEDAEAAERIAERLKDLKKEGHKKYEDEH